MSNDFKKFFTAVLIGVSITTIAASAKAYVDVERLKTQIVFVFDMLVEIKSDIKELKVFLLHKE